MFKYCHGCGGEFQQFVESCPECHEPLHATPATPEQLDAAAEQSAPLEEPTLVKVGEPWELRELAETLQAHGISSQVDSYPLGGSIGRAGIRGEPARLGIYVARADHDAVREFAANRAAEESPDGGDYDPNSCPACGEPTPENAAECSACGLEFPEIDPDAGR
jgi:hypothetical protein